TYTAPFTVSAAGTYSLWYRATDSTGAVEPSTRSTSFARAFTAPEITAITVTAAGDDAVPVAADGAHVAGTVTITATATGDYYVDNSRRVTELLFEYRPVGAPADAWATIGIVVNPTRTGDEYTGSVSFDT